MYSVGEEDGFVMVCARLTGQIERDVVVNFFADPDFRGRSPTVFFCLRHVCICTNILYLQDSQIISH